MNVRFKRFILGVVASVILFNVVVMNNSLCHFIPEFNSVINDRQRIVSNQVCDYKYQKLRLDKIGHVLHIWDALNLYTKLLNHDAYFCMFSNVSTHVWA